MQMNRRIEKLEAALLENELSYRVLFKHAGEPDPVAVPPLGRNEQPIVVCFVAPFTLRGR